jgi:quinol-cytochrome oxidoreductase complex cytochrome b subunit
MLVQIQIIPPASADEAATDPDHDDSEDPHGEKRYGYLGLDPGDIVDDHEYEDYVENVQEEAYAKANIDKARFGIFTVLTTIVYLSFANVQGISKRLKERFDWYALGTVTIYVLMVLIIPTGIIIGFYYDPSPTRVYQSVENIINIPVLSFMRNLHTWASEAFLVLIVLHAARTVSTMTYMGKRKIVWITGALLLILTWLSYASGTFMRGDQEAYEGFSHILYVFSILPLIKPVSAFFTGELTTMKLTIIHVGLTTFLFVILTAPHVLMRNVYKHILLRWKTAMKYSILLTVLLVIQSVFMTAPFVQSISEGEIITGVEITKPPWPIYFLVAGENLFGATAMIALPTIVFTILIVFPYLVERLPVADEKKARTGTVLFYLGLFILIASSYMAAASRIVAHIV